MSSPEFQQAFANSYLSGGNMAYLDALYEDYLVDPSLVSDEWREIFNALPIHSGQSEDQSHSAVREYFLQQAKLPTNTAVALPDKQFNVTNLVNAYRAQGHLAANLDPLEMMDREDIPGLSLEYHGLSAKAGADTFFFHSMDSKQTLNSIHDQLRATYCGSIGVEYMHIASEAERTWFQNRLESTAGNPVFSADEKKEILHELIAADGLERYLGTRYVGQKRFSLEGGDSLIPMLKSLIRNSCKDQIREIVIGMAHRGRLNVLINVLGKKPAELFQEFAGNFSDQGSRSGDVKYHLGFSSDLRANAADTNVVHTTLAFNPSHLEIIGPVVEGSVRSRLTRRNDLINKKSVMPVIIHGDAAFAGQGVVMETFNFSQARGYGTGGTVHIVINNQIGFTTSNPLDARSTLYCTDIAKMAQAPVLHINGEDPEAVVFATQLAFEFRMRFKRDVVLDLVCYRRQGHNEADEPFVTQPLMYKKIRALKPLREKYAAKLINDGLVTAPEVQQWNDEYRDRLDSGAAIVETVQGAFDGKMSIEWAPYMGAHWTDAADTRVSAAILSELSQKLLELPAGFAVHSVVQRLLLDREKMTAGEVPLNWGYAETMAYATLLHAGYEVRLSGQDCGRGTFAHRHAQIHDQNTGEMIVPLEKISTNPTKTFSVIDSVLSEEAVLAFEYGYSASEPNSLVLWEAQFGDFANGAQVVVDQFISSGEQKWGRLCGLVMLLPHGYEGQGPEHSSARLERYMQLCAEQNMQVCTPTTPAQIFHLLRRQMIRPWRKPLIVMTPKSLLRNKLAVSTMDDLTQGAFQLVIPEIDSLDPQKIKRVVLCCGKVYYDLLQKRRDDNQQDAAIVRIEQLYPFPTKELTHELKKYPDADQVIWCQEEPQNQGVWFSSNHHITECLESNQVLRYAGRGFAAAPAAGSHSLHVEQQNALVQDALKK